MTSLRLGSTIKLNDGLQIPRLGLGVYLTQSADAIKHALQFGYRHIDTAQWYENEEIVGEAFKASGMKREDVWITTKIWDTNHGYNQTTKTLEESLKKAGLDFFDLVLIHSPNPGKEKRLETYRALIDAKKQGKIKSAGVSNYGVHHIKELLAQFPHDPPSVNQIEISPFFQRKDIVSECRKHNIALQAYSPLGKGAFVDRPELHKIGEKYGKSPAQVLIRWSLQQDFIVLPKSSNEERIKANANLYDFELSKEDIDTLNAMETGKGITWDPTKAP